MRRQTCYGRYVQYAHNNETAGPSPKEANDQPQPTYGICHRDAHHRLACSTASWRDAQRYDAYLEENPRGNYDHELADFLLELQDETGRRAKRAEDLLAQRLADGGVQ
jgi:hypothetical protein